jgi:hypothetical protein
VEIIIGLFGFIGAIFLFIAAIATWVNTGATADYCKKQWLRTCEREHLDPKTGKQVAVTDKVLNG